MEGGPPTSYVEMYQAHLGIPARPILPFWAELKAVFPGRKFDAKFQVSMPSLGFPAKTKHGIESWHRTPCRRVRSGPDTGFDADFRCQVSIPP
jgi:hypothetical protein